MLHGDLKTKHNRFITFWLIVVFVLPVVGAYLLYMGRHYFTFKTTQAGLLLSPPIKADAFSFFSKDLLGKWQLIYLNTAVCDSHCQTTLSHLEKIHFALGKEKSRVAYRPVILHSATPPLMAGEIVIIDPQGWIIMHYPTHADLKGVLRDLRQLLRLSHAG